jgi:hypothetical protein
MIRKDDFREARRTLLGSGLKKVLENPNFYESIHASLVSKPVLRPPKVEVPEPLPARPPTVLKATMENFRAKQVSCNCKKSQCIKLYCECFRTLSFCKNCNCDCCLNKNDNQTRNNVISVIKQKDPGAFEPKYRPNKTRGAVEGRPTNDIIIDVSRGCNCKHSNCRKKYCECFQYGLECSAKCKCISCQNGNFQKNGREGPGEDGNNVTEAEKAALRERLLERLATVKRIKFAKSLVW